MRASASVRSAKGIVLWALLVALAACSRGEAPRPHQAVRIGGDRFAVRERVVDDLKPVAGTITTRNQAEARARIGGVLIGLSVREGDSVRKDQEIARIVDQRIGLETRGYAAQAVAAAAERERADAELARVETLHKSGFYATARLDQAQAAARAARAQFDAAEAQRAASAELAAQGIVRAPSNGRVLRADVPAGSVVTSGQTIAVITSGEPLIRLEIPEGQARALRVGQTIPIASEDVPGGPSSGTIVQIYPAVSAGRVVADIRAAGLRGELVGQRVRVRVKVGERKALLAPRRFVTTRFGVDFVRLLQAGGRTAEIAVQIAPTHNATEVELLSGVRAGDTIVAPGAAR